jgi:glycine dehydrogenase
MVFTPTEYLPYDFANRRHIGPSPDEMAQMLEVLGKDSLDQLIDETVPANIRQSEPLEFGKAKSERELLHYMRKVASKNKVLTSLIGQGYHGTVTPPVSSATCWKTLRGTPHTPLISPKSARAGLRLC